ncbi:MAG: HAMP domain-containing sensor histidine kinase [Planctomycetota bacterium]|nr:HAMP domain-containing sensor histidine kinase [Planctomycetota bacterium]MDP6941182.1 HAMP domain-containing sensor histidine kinase [Planctomycetota bacterium]
MSHRLPLWILLVAGLFFAQLGWWGLSLWRQGEALHSAGHQALLERRDLAVQELLYRVENGASILEAWEEISSDFPGLVRVATAEAGGHLGVQLSETAIRSLESDLISHHTMVLGEGSLSFLIALVAIWFLMKSVRRQQQLALQESNFLHAVTHEFRSPIQGIRLAVESLMRRPDPAKARSYSEGMLEDLHRLDSLVDNALTVGRLEAQALNPQIRPLNMSEAVQTTITSWCASNPAGAKLLDVEIENAVWAEADPAALQPILRNLLENAIKYGEGNRVTASLKAESGCAILRIRDMGRGFTSEERARLFERFWRAGDERVRTAQGTGLGLYLVSELARAQTAKVEAHSKGLGKGAEFKISWPESASKLNS